MIRKMLKYLLLLLVVLVTVLGIYAFWPFAPDLSHLASAGDEYDVEILRDSWGVPHVFGVTDADAAFGLGYAHAEDDFLTIQQGLAAARGDLALVYGADAGPNDFMVDLLRIWDVVDAQYDVELSSEVRAICEAYAAGVNVYASQNPDEAIRGLFPVTGKDVVAGSVHKSPLFFGLDGTLGRLFNQVSADNIPPPEDETWNPVTGIGSNTFAVGPSRSADGSTFFAVNSHQPWTGPVAWYEAHLHSEEGLDVVGGLFPGSPLVIHGHNRDLGWAFTVNSPDLIDVFDLVLNPDNPDQYLLDGHWVDFEIREVEIEADLLATVGIGDEFFGRFPWTVTQQAYWSAFGPVIRDEDTAFAIRYAGYGSVGIYEQLYRLNKATNLDEWQAAMQITGLPMFNVGYADKEGNIGYLYNGLLPLRNPTYDWSGHVTANNSGQIWDSYLPFDQLPQVFNPASGFVQNANSSPFQTTIGADNPSESAFSPNFGIETRMSNRAIRLLELFGADESITYEEFRAYKYDMTFSQASDMRDFVDRIVAAEFASADLQQAQALLREWDLQATPESRSATVATLTVMMLTRMDGVSINASKLVGNEIATDDLLLAFEQAVESLLTNFGTVNVPYLNVNRVIRGDVDMGMGGSADVPHAIYGTLTDNGRMRGIAGDSYILLVQWDADGNVSSESIHQFGSATLDETSPHYTDQIPLFVKRELKPVWLDEADIRANLERAYRP